MFTTNRLFVRPLSEQDQENFYDLQGNPNVMTPIPRKALSKVQSDARLLELMAKSGDDIVWAVCEKDQNELVGIAALMKNDVEQDEIAYQLREQYWGNGYGTELAKGLIDYCFNDLKFEFVTADVSVSNVRSVKILSKLMTPIQSFYNPKDRCNDRRYKAVNANS